MTADPDSPTDDGPTLSNADVYRMTHRQLVDLLGTLTDDYVEVDAPSCPGWRVRDVVAHVAGVATDMLDARFPTAGFDSWNAEQIEARAAAPFAEVIDEWVARAPDFAAAMDAHLAAASGNFAADVVTHEIDIRSALGVPCPTDHAGYDTATRTFVSMLGAAVNGAGLPGLRILAGDRQYVAGRTEPAVTLTGTPFEILRLISGRRTLVEILASDWEGDADAYAPLLSPYPLPQVSLGER